MSSESPDVTGRPPDPVPGTPDPPGAPDAPNPPGAPDAPNPPGAPDAPDPEPRVPDQRAARSAALARSNNRLAVAVVAGILGVLAIGQLRGQAGVPGLSGLSSTELTQLIANLNAGNDRLRDELGDLGRQEQKLVDARDRGQTVAGDLASDLARIRAWAGLTAVMGQGISILVTGPIGGDGVEEILNELRNAGAEAITVAGVRVVRGTVVAGAPGSLSVENDAIGETFEIRAIGSPQILTGTLTRTGGVIAQVGTTYPDAQLIVTPLESITLPATDRDLTLTNATPRL